MCTESSQILDFVRFIEPSEADRAAREGVVVAVSRIVASEWPQASVHVRSLPPSRSPALAPMRLCSSRRALLGGAQVFGSYSTGLFLPTSDIDLVVLHSGVSAVAGLRRIAEVRSLSSVPGTL
jgi:non-canonical poly(A) RNA polymerase PAPD5/7